MNPPRSLPTRIPAFDVRARHRREPVYLRRPIVGSAARNLEIQVWQAFGILGGVPQAKANQLLRVY